ESRDVHDPAAWEGKILCSDPERKAMDLVRQWGFNDAFRMFHEDGGHYSWWDYRTGAWQRNDGLRIDHIWITEPLVSRNVRTWIDLEPRTWEKPSDHAPTITEF
ncbi:MAG TPA: endonuclease/exonuclease/phosphatase family protein, partial [Pyrinomonadaceae bacterium]|nr:endonuclease/exonuclease/phosphatase family protein [Pyrinomonadaceae bacterium]